MVLGYWDSHGYPNFPTGTQLINELADAMSTWNWPIPGLTWPWAIDDGIITVCQNHGYNNIIATNDYSETWNKVVSEVSAQRPFIISMLMGGTPVGGSTAYGDHSVTCVGYVSGTFNYVTIHDTWDTTNYHLLTYGNWWDAMMTWVRP
jgi:hypothetical protein